MLSSTAAFSQSQLGKSMENLLFTMGQLGSHMLRHQNFGLLVTVTKGVAPSET